MSPDHVQSVTGTQRPVDGEAADGSRADAPRRPVGEPAYLKHGVESLVAMDNPDDAQPSPARPEVNGDESW